MDLIITIDCNMMNPNNAEIRLKNLQKYLNHRRWICKQDRYFLQLSYKHVPTEIITKKLKESISNFGTYKCNRILNKLCV